ncbi:MAG: SufD family Fe-S cluster assembly protein [bacterium]
MNNINFDYRNNQIFSESVGEELTNYHDNLEITGCFLMEEDNNSSLDISILHKGKATTSKVILRAVLKDSAHLNISGEIKISEEADNSNAYFEAKVIILGDKARATVVPELKIDNKFVTAKHAVVIKRISNQDLYFLSSRGLKRTIGEDMITKGFLTIP